MIRAQKDCRINANKAGLKKPNLATKDMNREMMIELMAMASLPGVGPVTIRKVLGCLASGLDSQIAGLDSRIAMDDSRGSGHPMHQLVEFLLGSDASLVSSLGSWGQRLARAMSKHAEDRVLMNNRAFYRREWEISQGEGIRWVQMYEADYPKLLNQCTNGPLLLYVKGNLPVNYDYSLAIVGTRNMSHYGAFLLRQYIEELSKIWQDPLLKPIVISGLARGVDTHAHELALECGMITLGVMANGLATVYPPQNRGLASRILKEGALISESPAHQSPDARLFASRNRIIAGMCQGTLVAEAAARGGALITARYAQEFGRQVLAFPGRVTDQTFRGCLQMIMQGQALMTCSPYDLGTLMQWPVGERLIDGERSHDLMPTTCTLGLGATKIRSVMDLHEPIGAEQLWENFSGDYSGFVCALFELESKGWITRTSAGALVRLR
jgi:DNA processing protein